VILSGKNHALPLIERDDVFSVTIIHALIHTGLNGQQPKDTGLRQPGSHELSYLGKKYDDIIKACQKNESRRPKAGGD